MKTLNPNIQIFDKLIQAERYFNKCIKPCHLLKARVGRYDVYFVDMAKEALGSWPDKYELLAEK
jgi:hypothetical protein